jgi:tRNA-specific 2-thiouridylase
MSNSLATNATQPQKSGKKVALGMSGGVDSSVCAHLLLEQGYDVTGVFMECWRAPGCRTDQDRKDALKIALELGIPFEVLDFKQTYKEKVVELFFKEYEAGLTPNPDVLCNKEIKFGLFYDWAMENDFEYIATGHYAKILQTNTDNFSLNQGKKTLSHLAIPADTHKDQTYFLYPITSEQLKHTLFPLQDLTKTQVREKAKSFNLHNADKKDSVGICFIGDINVHDFLRERLGEKPGDVVNKAGAIIGNHKGLWFYTIGQRHGFTINKKSVYTLDNGATITKENIPPFYVIDKNPDTNQLIVGFGADAQQDQITFQNLHLINPDYQPILDRDEIKNMFVRIRHTGSLLPVTKIEHTQNGYTLHLHESVSGVAKGQSAVLYLQEENNSEMLCLGGGIIVS